MIDAALYARIRRFYFAEHWMIQRYPHPRKRT